MHVYYIKKCKWRLSCMVTMYTCCNCLKHIFAYSFNNTQHRDLQKEALESVCLILYNGLVNILLEMYKKMGDNRGLTRNWFKCLYKRI